MRTQSQPTTTPQASGSDRPRWSPALTAAWWLVSLSPVALLVGMFMTMGDPATTFGFAAALAVPGAVCGVVGFATTRRWYALVPTVIVLSVAVWLGVLLRGDPDEVNNGIDPHVVAVRIESDFPETPSCRVDPDLVVAAGEHTLAVQAAAGTTVTITGPAPRSEVVATYVRPDDSDGFGPTMRLTSGVYTVTCSFASESATTELNVGP